MKTAWFGTAVLAAAIAAPVGMTPARAFAAAPAAAWHQDQDQNRTWGQAPDSYRDVQRRGYQEGIEAARRDAESGHHRDADDHDVYKHPPVDRRDRSAFRDAFRQGYSDGMRHMNDNGSRRHHDDDDNPHQK